LAQTVYRDTHNDTNDKIKQISRARLPENPESTMLATQTYHFLFIMKLQLQLTTIRLKTHKEKIQKKNKVTTH